MSESLSAITALFMIVGMIGSIMVWMADKSSLAAKLGFPTLCVFSLIALIWSLFRPEKLPDFLRQVSKRVFERDGFCFALATRNSTGLCYVDVHFQSRYDRSSWSTIVLQPARGFFLNRPGVGSMTIQVECPPAGYGVTTIPWAVPKKYQGKKLALEVGANPKYPEGRGKLVRYRGGMQVGAAGNDGLKIAMTVAGAMAGMIVVSSKAREKILLPVDVAETVDDSLPIATEIRWKLGDPFEISTNGAKKQAVPISEI